MLKDEIEKKTIKTKIKKKYLSQLGQPGHETTIILQKANQKIIMKLNPINSILKDEVEKKLIKK